MAITLPLIQARFYAVRGMERGILRVRARDHPEQEFRNPLAVDRPRNLAAQHPGCLLQAIVDLLEICPGRRWSGRDRHEQARGIGCGLHRFDKQIPQQVVSALTREYAAEGASDLLT
jgi:hypothetical protein